MGYGRKYRRAYDRALIDIYEGRFHGDGSRLRSRTEQNAYADALMHCYDPDHGVLRRPPAVYGGGGCGYGGYGGGYGGYPGYGYAMGPPPMQYTPMQMFESPFKIVLDGRNPPRAEAGTKEVSNHPPGTAIEAVVDAVDYDYDPREDSYYGNGYRRHRRDRLGNGRRGDYYRDDDECCGGCTVM